MVMNLRSEKSRDEGGGRELYQMSAKVAGNGGDTSLSQFGSVSQFSLPFEMVGELLDTGSLLAQILGLRSDSVANALAMIGQPVSEVDLVFYTLTGLGPSAKAIMSACLLPSPFLALALLFSLYYLVTLSNKVIQTVGRDAQYQTNIIAETAPLVTAPVIVLVNKNTASASEIVASALHDNCRAVLVGERTFGKGLIQSVFELHDGSGVVVTIGKYVTPNHMDINGNGIEPDFQKFPGKKIISLLSKWKYAPNNRDDSCLQLGLRSLNIYRNAKDYRKDKTQIVCSLSLSLSLDSTFLALYAFFLDII
ncbi:hypothetical protein RHGRI_005058 [Rhododendron griersonianum]|uniref:Tail specific protease domain-containing protein n=1 Tax=Rhododendron griersonianum TaxID=479676 RepID=A0AAV6LC14_9ERIC|nr:hypothetical protein RHGRI_005058 [Rhododendron griersonianum]